MGRIKSHICPNTDIMGQTVLLEMEIKDIMKITDEISVMANFMLKPHIIVIIAIKVHLIIIILENKIVLGHMIIINIEIMIIIINIRTIIVTKLNLATIFIIIKNM